MEPGATGCTLFRGEKRSVDLLIMTLLSILLLYVCCLVDNGVKLLLWRSDGPSRGGVMASGGRVVIVTLRTEAHNQTFG